MTRERLCGILLVAASSVAYSTAGFYTRLIPLDPWTILFWRGVFAGGFIAVWVAAREGRRTAAAVRAMGRPGLVVAACSGIATILFINAFRHTSVAQVVIILATLPFVTAAIGRVAFAIRESRATLAASALALLGVGLMVGGAGPRGLARAQILGVMLAFGTTVLMAIMMLVVRRHRARPMLPAAAASAFLAALLAWPMAAPGAVDARDLGELAMFGVTQFGLGLLLLTLGTRLISATESALIGTLEVPLAAFWVWLAFAETPRWSTVAGGAGVIAAVLWHVGRSLSAGPVPAAATGPAPRSHPMR